MSSFLLQFFFLLGGYSEGTVNVGFFVPSNIIVSCQYNSEKLIDVQNGNGIEHNSVFYLFKYLNSII